MLDPNARPTLLLLFCWNPPPVVPGVDDGEGEPNPKLDAGGEDDGEIDCVADPNPKPEDAGAALCCAPLAPLLPPKP